MFFIVIIGILQLPELFIPFRLKRIRHQSVVRIDLHKATLGKIGFVFRPFHLLFTQLVSLVETVFQFRDPNGFGMEISHHLWQTPLR